MKIAFIGLGNMGGGMAANLVNAGHQVNAFDLSEDALSAAQGNGCATFTSAAEACASADAVVSMLPNGTIVKAVYASDVFGKAPKGAILLDCSTIDVATAREVITVAESSGYEMVDAPVSGGIAAMGKSVIHAGDAGNGQGAKICNNMLLGIHMIGTAEAFSMAQKLGLDPQTFYDISSVSSGQNWSMTSYCPVPGVGPQTPADNDYQGGFATALMLKDLKLAMEAAETSGSSTPLGKHAQEIYEAFSEENGGLDFSAIIKTL
jgi:3-hydroxyisobutyrate dehydrogenase